jgi:hypothetical protein
MLLVVLSCLQFSFPLLHCWWSWVSCFSTVIHCTTSSFGFQSSKPTQRNARHLPFAVASSRIIQPTKATARLKAQISGLNTLPSLSSSRTSRLTTLLVASLLRLIPLPCGVKAPPSIRTPLRPCAASWTPSKAPPGKKSGSSSSSAAGVGVAERASSSLDSLP